MTSTVFKSVKAFKSYEGITCTHTQTCVYVHHYKNNYIYRIYLPISRILNMDLKILHPVSGTSYSKLLYLFFLILQFLFSYDFGFLQTSSPKNTALTYFSLVPAIILSFTCLVWNFENKFVFQYMFFTCEYAIYVFALFALNAKKRFRAFLDNMYLIDSELNFTFSFLEIDFKLILCLIIINVYKFVIIFLSEFVFSTHNIIQLNNLSDIFMTIFVDIPTVPCIYLFLTYHIYQRLNILGIVIQDQRCSAERGQHLYKLLFNTLENAKGMFNFVVSNSNLTNFYLVFSIRILLYLQV